METSREGDVTLNILHSFLPHCPRRGQFSDHGQERLFQRYARRIKWDAIDSIFVVGLVFDIHVIVLHVLRFDRSYLPLLAAMAASCCVNSGMLVLFMIKFNFRSLYRLVPYVAWLLFTGQFYVALLYGNEMLIPSSLVEWQLLSIYFVHAVLPVQSGMAFLLNVISCVLLSFVSTREYVDTSMFKTANMVR